MSIGARLRKAIFWPHPSLIFFVTNRCDSRCRHCFAHEIKSDGDLTVEEARDFAVSIGRLADLSISGGEPMMRKDLVELLAPFFEIGRPKSCTLPTGGLHPEQSFEVAQRLAADYPRTRLIMNLPIEGGRDLHNQIRGRKDAYDKLKATYDALVPLVKIGVIQIKLGTTLSSANQHAIDEIIETALTDFPDAVFHHFELMRCCGPEGSITPPDEDIILAEKDRIYSHWQRYDQFYGAASRLAVAAKKELFEIELAVLANQTLPFVCRAHEMGVVLYPDGDVAYCELTPPIGNIRRTLLSSILANSAARIERLDIESGCKCTHSCFLPKSLLASPRNVIKVLERAVKNK